MGYDTSMYQTGGMNGMSGPYNPINADATYFPDTTEVPTAIGGSMSAGMMGGGMADSPVDPTPIPARTIMGKPATWWVMLVVVFAVFVFASRKFGGPEKFGNVKLTVWNGIFSVIWFVIVLNFLKVFFARFKVPGLSELVAAA